MIVVVESIVVAALEEIVKLVPSPSIFSPSSPKVSPMSAPRLTSEPAVPAKVTSPPLSPDTQVVVVVPSSWNPTGSCLY